MSETESNRSEEPHLQPAPGVRVRGRGDRIVLELPAEASWDAVLSTLEAHLARAAGFFAGESVVVDLGARPLEAEALHTLRDLLAGHQMQIACLLAEHETTRAAARTLDLAVEDALTPRVRKDRLRPPWEVLLPARVDEAKAAGEPSAPKEAEGKTAFPSEEGTLPPVPPYVFRGVVRSGQVLRHAGTIVLLGDVNPGGHVIAGGDVLVWGRLWGMVHAGALGDDSAIVAALDFEPVQLRIGHRVARTPKGDTEAPARWFKRLRPSGPEIARVVKGQIVVEAWDTPGARFLLGPGSPSALIGDQGKTPSEDHK